VPGPHRGAGGRGPDAVVETVGMDTPGGVYGGMEDDPLPLPAMSGQRSPVQSSGPFPASKRSW
jgi:hypothetical protein